MSDAIITRSIALRDRMRDCAKAFRIIGGRMTTKTAVDLWEMDAKACDDAADMLQKLGLEVDRLRQGIGCNYYQGDPDRNALYRMTQNWNGDPK